MIALVSLIFIAMIPIDCKISKFSLHLLYLELHEIIGILNLDKAFIAHNCAQTGDITWISKLKIVHKHLNDLQSRLKMMSCIYENFLWSALRENELKYRGFFFWMRIIVYLIRWLIITVMKCMQFCNLLSLIKRCNSKSSLMASL